ncbi:MAG: dTDP-4-dehydrorhamnose reductase [Candidatus Neomarinimicrobiota bacterium]|nr:MAG: dTDP-4-dehydrorhamnose reductase [Candidatus Neomarinimicrobiota bacterium]
MNILITGANGMLGEKCVELLSHSHSVIASDLGEKLLCSSSVPYRMIDITDEEAIISCIRELKPDVVLNCAAYTDVDGAEKFKDLAWNVNVEGVKNLVSAINPIGSHLIHISSDYVFDGSNGPYTEEDETNPINYYGETKLASEKLLETLEVSWTIIRTNVLFGNSHFQEASFVHWVVKKIRNHEKIRVVNDQFGNPTWIDGLAQAIEVIIDKKAYGLYHYGGLDYVNRFEFALEIAAIFSLDPTFVRVTTTRALGQSARRPYKAGLISDKIEKELDVKIFTIKEALNAMKEFE